MRVALSKLRIHRIASGSSPFTGSSRTRTSGLPSSAAAIPSRWAHAERESLHPLSGDTAQTDKLDDLVNALARQALRLRQHEQVVVRATTAVHGARLEQCAYNPQRFGKVAIVPTVNGCAAGVGAVEPEEEPHRRRFAGTVRPKEPSNRAGLHGERKMIHRELVAVPLAEIAPRSRLPSLLHVFALLKLSAQGHDRRRQMSRVRHDWQQPGRVDAARSAVVHDRKGFGG